MKRMVTITRLIAMPGKSQNAIFAFTHRFRPTSRRNLNHLHLIWNVTNCRTPIDATIYGES